MVNDTSIIQLRAGACFNLIYWVFVHLSKLQIDLLFVAQIDYCSSHDANWFSRKFINIHYLLMCTCNYYFIVKKLINIDN